MPRKWRLNKNPPLKLYIGQGARQMLATVSLTHFQVSCRKTDGIFISQARGGAAKRAWLEERSASWALPCGEGKLALNRVTCCSSEGYICVQVWCTNLRQFLVHKTCFSTYLLSPVSTLCQHVSSKTQLLLFLCFQGLSQWGFNPPHLPHLLAAAPSQSVEDDLEPCFSNDIAVHLWGPLQIYGAFFGVVTVTGGYDWHLGSRDQGAKYPECMGHTTRRCSTEILIMPHWETLCQAGLSPSPSHKGLSCPWAFACTKSLLCAWHTPAFLQGLALGSRTQASPQSQSLCTFIDSLIPHAALHILSFNHQCLSTTSTIIY